MSEVEEHERRRSELKRWYKAAYERLSAVLYAEDPAGLNFGDNPDEYETEVGTILPRLSDCHSEEETCRVIQDEFARGFDPDFAGPISKYKTVAERVWSEVVSSLPK